MEMCLTGTNIQIFDHQRRLMKIFMIDLPTKARSTKNLFGLKQTSQTREGILYIFNDMVLITTIQGKVELFWSLSITIMFIHHIHTLSYSIKEAFFLDQIMNLDQQRI